MNFEILAPAGSPESLIAGVRSGANAVYLGGRLFNARRNAGNFDDDELKKAVEYCKQRDVKVYQTLNILISDSELEDAYNAVLKSLQAGVDAFIVQDIGVAEMMKEYFPKVRLHGSTQMSILTPAGLRLAKELGFSRVVLPREMSLEEIKEMRNGTDLELELFVHGALCMSVSGQCYMSSMIGARSGNRGLCAQPCRLPFSAGGSVSHALSLKDLSLIGDLALLEGITSLKIEGRMKRPEYVSAAVTALKKAIDGAYEASDEKALKSVFSRSGFTDGYLKGKLGYEMLGTRQKEDVVAAEGVLKEISRNYEKENPLIPLDISFTCRRNKASTLIAKSSRKTVIINGDIPEDAVNKPMNEEALKVRLSKLGGTQYYAKSVDVSLDDGLILPVSKINEMRRRAVEELDKTEIQALDAKPFELITNKSQNRSSKNQTPYATAAFKSVEQVPLSHPFKRIFIPLSSPIEDFIDCRAGAVLPRGAFGCEQKIIDRLKKLKKAGINKLLCPDLSGYRLASEMGFEAFGDFSLNIFNSLSAAQISSPILSFELTLKQINDISAVDKGVIVYGKMPLMLTRNCPVKNDIGCAKCKKSGVLTDRTNAKFEVLCNDYPCVEILNGVPVYMLDMLDEINTSFVHFHFTNESVKEVEHIISLYESRQKPDFKFTRGLYKRGVL